jgi:16S rRNA (guanine(966)-N(2))-methyltransferase RsmD
VTRIVAGALGGRRLSVPAGDRTRPTSDRVREALFSTLESLVDLSGARFADLYAGSGAVGLEALSRGAASALLVESDARVARVARQNIAALAAGEAARLVVGRVAQVLAGKPGSVALPAGLAGAHSSAEGGAAYDVVFADPPYAVPESEITAMLAALVDGGWLTADAVVAVERSSRSPAPQWVPGLTLERCRRYGETALWYGRRS